MNLEDRGRLRATVGRLLHEEPPDNAPDHEDDFLVILAIGRAHENRTELSALFAQMLKGETPTPEWLIPFCMRELRWPEIRELAQQMSSHPSVVLSRLAQDTLEAYETRWDGDLMFDHFGSSCPGKGG